MEEHNVGVLASPSGGDYDDTGFIGCILGVLDVRSTHFIEVLLGIQGVICRL